MFTRGSVTLFRVRGIPLRAHWTLLLIIPYLAFALSAQFGDIAGRAGVPSSALTLPPFVWGIVLALGLFASVAIHELAHVWIARRKGGRVHGITLMLLGGVSHVSRMPARPAAEALMAAAGPAISVALGVVLGAGYLLIGDQATDVRMALFYLASMNLMLGVFNLLPAFPMDGGRILRAALASRWGNLRATRAAAAVGRGLAIAMGILGLATGNMLLVLVAVFVFVGAGAEASSVHAATALEGLSVRDLLPPLARAPALTDTAPLVDALPRMRVHGRSELVIIDGMGTPIAVLTAAELAQIPPGARLTTTARDILPRLTGRHVVISTDDTATEALEQAAEAGAAYLIVHEPRSHGLALLTANDVATAVALRLAESPGDLKPQARPGAA